MRRLALILVFLPNMLLADMFIFGVIHRLPAVQIDATRFEVIARGGRVGAQDYWCAAGLFGLSQGLRSNTRVYLVAPVGPSVMQPGRKAVQFTFDPQAAGVTPIAPQLTLSVKAVGDNMSLALARQFCGDMEVFGF
ncbi:hypothetical protein [Aestuariivita boseongensis]|uniref:hypothetical protein n=1 Tax=Aestuariivita boseongensis TaxID=1470562 RepID=UPI0006810B70|nr:hypothetical protein [Aestuariivita boseongensis]